MRRRGLLTLVACAPLFAALTGDPATGQQLTGLFYFAAQNLQTGVVEQRGVAGSNGIAFDNLLLAPNTAYRLWLLQASTLRIDNPSVITTGAGGETNAPEFQMEMDGSADRDGDGLHDDGEFIMGTNPDDADSDEDGVDDAAEIRQGTNPTDGFPARTGVIASADTPGTAKDVCTFNDMAVIADGDRGVSVFNVFNGMDPVIIAQVDTPGSADRVACAGDRIAVADGSAGLAIIDISDPPAARITRQVTLSAPARAVAAGGTVAYAGLDNGKVVAVDLEDGVVLTEGVAGGAVHDLRLEGDVLHVLVQHEVRSYEIFPELLAFRGRIGTSPNGPEQVVGTLRLFVGGRTAYPSNYIGFDTIGADDPTDLRFLGKSIDSGPRGFKQIVANGSGLGIAAVGLNIDSPGDIWLYDVSDPLVTDRVVTEFAVPGGARAVSLFNGIAYGAAGDAGMQAVNYLSFDAQGQPPSITLSTNFVGNRAEEGQIMRVSADVADDVQVRNVELYIDGVRVATDGDFPFEHRFVVPPLSTGGFVLRARASDTGGNATLTDDMPITIVADATAPRVTVSPSPNGLGSRIEALAAFFNEPMDPATLTGALMLQVRGAGGSFTPVTGGTLEYRDEIAAAYLRFAQPLAPGRYMATLAGSVADRAGNTVASALTWSFTLYDLGADRDLDCIPDTIETAIGLNPDDRDSDDDNVLDGDEDPDGDGLANCGEVVVGADPSVQDTDGNGTLDGAEDADSDGLSDGEEAVRGTDAFVTDLLDVNTDGDGLDDGAEVALGTDPTVPNTVADITIDNRTVSLSGHVRLDALRLRNGAVLTHPRASSNAVYRLDLDITGALEIDATSRIDVTARGYLSGAAGNNSDRSGRTLGNVPGSTGDSGGSYGGLGAIGTDGTNNTANPVYGDFRDPNEVGSGGGTACFGNGPGGGGGLVRISAGSVQLDGLIVADGGAERHGCAGGGSGGGIKLVTQTLAGSGTVRANGSVGGDGGAAGGGGGRIALYFTGGTFNVGNVEARGGNGTQTGGPGTIFVQRGAQPAELIVRGTGRETPLTDTAATERVTVDAATVAIEDLQMRSLTLSNGAVLTHPRATTMIAPFVQLTLESLSVDATSRIDVTGRGYLSGTAGDNPDRFGLTLGNVPGSEGDSGGSYGGLGAIGTDGNSNRVNPVYGDFRDPNEVGSGGGTACFGNGIGGGGGLVRISAADVRLDGMIVADGAAERHGCAGGGSGGGVKVVTQSLTGSGSVRANGSVGGDGGAAGGGGGRIALYFTGGTFNVGNVEARGGNGTQMGGPGTIFVQRGAQPAELIVRGMGRETPLTDTAATERITVDAAMLAIEDLQMRSLTLRNGAVLTHPRATTSSAPFMQLTLESLIVDASSRIDVTGRGYLSGTAGDNRDRLGRTFGNAPGSTNENGGSYGGLGGISDDVGTVNSVYGDFRDPNELGSGGGTACFGNGPGGGGGLVRINATDIELDGMIVADGAAERHGCAGGGSGGGVKIVTETFSGNGSVRANGSLGGDGLASGGGGGRIAVYFGSGTFDVAKLHAIGGGGIQTGGAGTIYIDGPGGAALRVDAEGIAPSQVTPLISLGRGTSTNVGGNTLTDAAARFSAGALVGLALRPDVTQSQTFRIIANDASTIVTDPAAGELRAVASEGSTYEAIVDVDALTITNRAVVEVLDGNRNRADRRGHLAAVELALANGGALTHPTATTSAFFGLEIDVAGSLDIDAASTIDVSGRGFLGGDSASRSADEGTSINTERNGRTLGNTTAGGSTGESGGSYGGLGGALSGDPNAGYGDPRDPDDPGSGAAVACFGGPANGGGIARISAAEVNLDGVIAADGSTARHGCSGGGSGGAIKVVTDMLAGSGTIRSNGAMGGDGGAAGGGGGRVAIFATDRSAFVPGTVTAAGGAGQVAGSAGTVVSEAP